MKPYLTFENDLDEVQRLAKRCAGEFCRITGRVRDFDDAEADALVLLVTIPVNFDRSGWRLYLKKRVVGELVRKLQKATGRRLKNPPTFAELGDDVPDGREPEEFDEPDPEPMTDAEAIAAALGKFRERDREIITAFISGEKQNAIAKRHALTRFRICQIISDFKNITRTFKEIGRGVAIAPPSPDEKEKERCPLFYLED